jgi:hypothetical protein
MTVTSAHPRSLLSAPRDRTFSYVNKYILIFTRQWSLELKTQEQCNHSKDPPRTPDTAPDEYIGDKTHESVEHLTAP